MAFARQTWRVCQGPECLQPSERGGSGQSRPGVRGKRGAGIGGGGQRGTAVEPSRGKRCVAVGLLAG
jgi:hypothetical protein